MSDDSQHKRVENPDKPKPDTPERAAAGTTAAAAYPPAEKEAKNGRKEQARDDRPWWQSPHWVTLWAAVIAAMAPLATAIYGYIKGQSDLRIAVQKQEHEAELANQRQQHEIQSFYFGLAVAKDSDPVLRRRVLRFLVKDEDPRIRDWAQSELQEVVELLQLRETLQETTDQLRDTEAQIAGSQTQRESLTQEKAALEQKIRRLSIQVSRRLPQSASPKPAAQMASHDALICRPNTTQMEFHPRTDWQLCGAPNNTAYRGLSGRIFWTVRRPQAEGFVQATCFCDPSATAAN